MTLKELRISKGIYPSFIAKSLGISVRHFHRIENGQGYLTEERAEKIAEILGVEMSEIKKCYGGNAYEGDIGCIRRSPQRN